MRFVEMFASIDRPGEALVCNYRSPGHLIGAVFNIALALVLSVGFARFVLTGELQRGIEETPDGEFFWFVAPVMALGMLSFLALGIHRFLSFLNEGFIVHGGVLTYRGPVGRAISCPISDVEFLGRRYSILSSLKFVFTLKCGDSLV